MARCGDVNSPSILSQSLKNSIVALNGPGFCNPDRLLILNCVDYLFIIFKCYLLEASPYHLSELLITGCIVARRRRIDFKHQSRYGINNQHRFQYICQECEQLLRVCWLLNKPFRTCNFQLPAELSGHSTVSPNSERKVQRSSLRWATCFT